MKSIFVCWITFGIFSFLPSYAWSVEDSPFVETLNRYGWAATALDPLSEGFVNTARTKGKPVLDIGTAYGFVALAALSTGANVIANDIDERHLKVVRETTPHELSSHLVLSCGAFPNELDFEASSLGAVLASRVLHFLTGSQIEEGLRKIHHWLEPGGKLFILANSPFRKNLRSFLADYEGRKRAEKFPGIVIELREVNPEQADNLPSFFHYVDADILSRELARAGFDIEYIGYPQIQGLNPEVLLDGRENVGAIAVKPFSSLPK